MVKIHNETTLVWWDFIFFFSSSALSFASFAVKSAKHVTAKCWHSKLRVCHLPRRPNGNDLLFLREYPRKNGIFRFPMWATLWRQSTFSTQFPKWFKCVSNGMGNRRRSPHTCIQFRFHSISSESIYFDRDKAPNFSLVTRPFVSTATQTTINGDEEQCNGNEKRWNEK